MIAVPLRERGAAKAPRRKKRGEKSAESRDSWPARQPEEEEQVQSGTSSTLSAAQCNCAMIADPLREKGAAKAPRRKELREKEREREQRPTPERQPKEGRPLTSRSRPSAAQCDCATTAAPLRHRRREKERQRERERSNGPFPLLLPSSLFPLFLSVSL